MTGINGMKTATGTICGKTVTVCSESRRSLLIRPTFVAVWSFRLQAWSKEYHHDASYAGNLAGLLVGLAIPATANAAFTRDTVNLRTGPGTGYSVITTLPAGAFVNVGRCVPRWCRVATRGVVGWMSAAYIGAGPRVYRPPVHVYRPYVYAPYPYYTPYYAYPPYGGVYFNSQFGPHHPHRDLHYPRISTAGGRGDTGLRCVGHSRQAH